MEADIPRVLYNYINTEDHLDFVRLLNKKADWRPFGLILPDSTSNLTKLVSGEKLFENCDFFNAYKQRTGEVSWSVIENKHPIDQNDFDKLAKYLINYMSWLEDSDGYKLGFKERLDYVLEILFFWKSYLIEKKIDIIACYTWPHLQNDFGLYLVAKYLLKRTVLFTDITPFFNSRRFFINWSLEELSAPIELSKKKDLGKIEVNTTKYLKELRSSDGVKPAHAEAYHKIVDNHEKRRIYRYIKILFKLATFKAFSLSQSSIRMKKKSLGRNAPNTFLADFIFEEKLRYKNLSNKRYYLKQCSTPDFNEKYIYFAAPFQPEAISNLNQGIYENVQVIVDLLDSVVPKNIKIYYKEHPSSFKPYGRGAMSRNLEYYEKLKRIDRLKFVQHELDPFQLIDNAVCVVTVGGTVGWEAVNRKKHCLLFGTNWYETCEGVHTINHVKDLEKAMSVIARGERVRIKKVDEFVKKIEKSSFPHLFTAREFFQGKRKFSEDELVIGVANTSDAFIKTFQNLENLKS